MQSIIIPTFQSEEDLKGLVAEIKESAVGEYELIVTGQQGSAAFNRNYGLNKAQGDVIIMLDDDMKDFPHGWNEALAGTLTDSIVLVGARLIAPDGSLGLNMGGNYDVSKDVAEVESGYIPTACVCFRAHKLRYDEEYIGSGFEDTDMCNQFMREYPNGKHVINNLVRIVHVNEKKNQLGDNWRKNHMYFARKWAGFGGRGSQLEIKDKKISLCMIVKNEERNLARCLESAKPRVDEIIIVDTGSTDKTKEIALKYGAQVFDFEWIEDFAAARNFGLRKATGDWILVLDADEELIQCTKKDLVELANVPLRRHVSYMIRIENIMDGGAQVEHHMARMFPNSPDVYYEGTIHEYVRSAEGVPLVSVVMDKIKIRHHGYGSAGVSPDKNKAQRNVDLLEAEMKKNPENAFYLYHLAVTYRVTGDHEKALECFKKWDEIVTKNNEQVDLSMGYAAYLGELLFHKLFDEAIAVGAKIAHRCSHNPDFCLNYAISMEHKQSYELALTFLEKALELKNNKYPSLSYDRDAMGWKALAVMGNIYAQKGEYQKAVEVWKKGLDESPTNKDILKALFSIMVNTGDLLGAEVYLKKFIEFYPTEDKEQNQITLANIMFNTGRQDDALEKFYGLEKGKEYIEQLLSTLIAYQKFDLVKKIDEFLELKESKEVKK